MVSEWIKLFLIFFSLFLFSNSFSEIFYLKNQEKIEGIILSEDKTNDTVRIKTKAGTVSIQKSEIEKIIYRDLPDEIDFYYLKLSAGSGWLDAGFGNVQFEGNNNQKGIPYYFDFGVYWVQDKNNLIGFNGAYFYSLLKKEKLTEINHELVEETGLEQFLARVHILYFWDRIGKGFYADAGIGFAQLYLMKEKSDQTMKSSGIGTSAGLGYGMGITEKLFLQLGTNILVIPTHYISEDGKTYKWFSASCSFYAGLMW